MAKLHIYDPLSAGATLNAGATTTYRVIYNGTDAAPSNKVEQPSRRLEFREWLRCQNPADIVRTVLTTIAIGAIIFTTVCLG